MIPDEVIIKRRRKRRERMRRYRTRKKVERHGLALYQAVLLVLIAIAFMKGYMGA